MEGQKWQEQNSEGVTDSAGPPRLLLTCATFTARYRDAHGIVHEVSTGCRTKSAAERVLADLRQRVELVKSGVMTDAQDSAACHLDVPLKEHIEKYVDHLGINASPHHIRNVKGKLRRLSDECGFKTLQDLKADRLVSWMKEQTSGQEPLGHSTVNRYRTVLFSFAKWCVQTGRLLSNPFMNVPRLNERTDVRHQRRALTDEEIGKLLLVARLRPIAEYGRDVVKTDPTPCDRKRSNWERAPLDIDTIELAAKQGRSALAHRPTYRAELERIGSERALIYKTLLMTGLRKGELASITLAHVFLDAAKPHLLLTAKGAKNSKDATIWLRKDLAQDIRVYLQQEAERNPTSAQNLNQGGYLGLDPARPLFVVPRDLSRILDRDLQAAGIPKRDARNRVVDVHAMRHTFGTQLHRAGVPLRTAQEAMRHSSPELTANVYADTSLLDVSGAIDSLPEIPLEGSTGATE